MLPNAQGAGIWMVEGGGDGGGLLGTFTPQRSKLKTYTYKYINKKYICPTVYYMSV